MEQPVYKLVDIHENHHGNIKFHILLFYILSKRGKLAIYKPVIHHYFPQLWKKLTSFYNKKKCHVR